MYELCRIDREIVSHYCVEVRELGYRLQELISESLGLEKDYIKNVLGEQGQHMAINYYPPCPKPELTYGFPGYTDPSALTILLQDLQVAGLQVLKDGKWVAVNPYPNAFVINIGDQLQALSNGKYKSVWHQAIVNANKERMYVASFLCPYDHALISPAKPLKEDGCGAVYRDFTFAEYYTSLPYCITRTPFNYSWQWRTPFFNTAYCYIAATTAILAAYCNLSISADCG
ncbi:hypothetical protein REPUB_Repub08aG0148100 [Reevesia pubescens]